MKQTLLFLFLVVSLLACNSTRKASQSTDFELYISRYGCKGPCPVDELFVDTKGMAYYQGVSNVAQTGNFVRQLSQAELQQIASAMQKARFGDFDAEYNRADVMDVSAFRIKYIQAGVSHEVYARFEVPPALTKLHEQLQGIVHAEAFQAAQK
jgi:Domain of unknown function (DUF6438)